MPFFAWRTKEPLRKDPRHMTDGSRLRNHIDLSFLSESKSKKILTEGNEYLYEGQSSVCVTGRNTVVWTALCLADTHFDNPDPNNEYLLSFYDNTEDSDTTSLPMDALSVGSRTAINMSGLDPREYFLLVVKFRVQRIKDEWIKILYELKDRTNAYVRLPPTFRCLVSSGIPIRVQRVWVEIFLIRLTDQCCNSFMTLIFPFVDGKRRLEQLQTNLRM